jgi:hypothetical protein
VNRKIVWIVVLLLVGGVGLGNAQQPSGTATSTDAQTASTPVRAGAYKDLNFWRSLKLGTASFVDPGLAKSAAIAYRYHLSDLKTLDSAELSKVIEAHKLALGTQGPNQNGEITVNIIDTPGLTLDATKKLIDLWLKNSEAAGKNAFFISPFSTLADKLKGTPIVSWAPAEGHS